MRFDLVDLKLFLNIVEAGSITHGARHSSLTLQAASERLRGMESELGVSLMNRSRAGISLTDAGFSLQHHAQGVLSRIECMRSELRQYGQGLQGRIRLLCNSAAQSEYLPELVGEFLKINGKISIEVKEKVSSEIVSDLKNKAADLGIVADSVDLDGLCMAAFSDDHLVVVVPSKSDLLATEETCFADVVHYEFIGLAEGSALQQSIEGHARKMGVRMNYRVRLASFDAIAQVISSGVGLGIMPRQAAQRLGKLLDLRMVKLKDDWALRKLMICFRDFKSLPGYYQELVSFLLKRRPQPLP
ncbi:LysR family transcriptional regulator [Pseudomonas sp. S75]|uniref:LysR family transcriptional regulator n=1 Tax=unclassified Pseudomonas TaxID=196821 RepID=UPI001907C1C5|nr:MULTISPECIES: LysR family transcriptional regulator [unclassified Pseudomonas]MBJ9977621.1 LysR family transcriptional regulator [Pseudomonas sp. S30]MBK0154993.1 LysR family transcriptional regulator [Pseudomonas sp. S75]